jgi:hypothetical protein
LNNRVGRYFNIERPGGTQTEMGSFYFCRHPDYLPKLAKTATGFFAVDTLTGLAKYYANNSQAGGTVRRHRENNTTTKNGIRYINEEIFIKHYPEAIAKEGSTYQLEMEQVRNLPNNN